MWVSPWNLAQVPNGGLPPCQGDSCLTSQLRGHAWATRICILPHLRSQGGCHFRFFYPHPGCFSKGAVEVGGEQGEVFTLHTGFVTVLGPGGLPLAARPT